jgi:hypothetical protein
MVPGVQGAPVSPLDGSCDELEVRIDSRSALFNNRDIDTLEYGFQGERRKQRDRMCRMFGQLLILILVSTACSWAAYQYAWHSFWAANLAGEKALVYKPIEDHTLYIGILSAPGNFKQRSQARLSWVQELRDDYPTEKVKVEFLIGQVPIQGNQLLETGEVVALENEKKMERDLQDEEKLHKDISRVPVVEAPLFRAHKTLMLLSNGVSWKARFVMQTTDAEVIDAKVAVEALNKHSPMDPPVYFGMDYDPDNAAEADGKRTWFFDRDCFGLSGELAYNIVKTHLLHTMAWPVYGTSKAAVDVAKWVKYEDDERKKRNVEPVEHIWLPRIAHNIATTTTPLPPPIASSPCAPGAPPQ